MHLPGSAVSAAVSRKRAALNVSEAARSTNLPQPLTKPCIIRKERIFIPTSRKSIRKTLKILTSSSAVFRASLIPKKRISRKIETNGMGKGKDFGKFGIKFWMQSGIIIMQA